MLFVLHLIACAPTTAPKNTSDTGTADSGADTTDTGNADTADTGNADTADTGNADTADTGNVDTADTGNADTADTGNADTADTGNADTADTAGPDLCADLAGSTWSSVDELECGRTPYGVALCHWRLTFTTSDWSWHGSDYAEAGAWSCTAGNITSDGWDGTRVRGVRSDATHLSWDGIAYVRE